MCPHRKGILKVTGGIRSEETVKAEKLWIQGVQSELKAMPNFMATIREVGIVNCDGILKFKVRCGG